MTKKTRFFPLFLLVAQVALYAAAWKTVAPKETDFPAFYAAARLWRKGGNPYDLNLQCVEQVPIRGEPCLPFAHPPVLLPLVALISTDDFGASYHRWVLILLLTLALCFIPLYHLSQDWVVSFQALLFLPIFIAVTLGQDTPFIMLGVVLWMWLISTEKDIWGGLALSLAVVKPQIAILLALPLLFSRPKAFLGFCAGSLILTAYSFALVGGAGFRGLINIVRVMSQGHGFGVRPEAMFNATGLLVRVGISATWSWLVFVLALIAISLMWRKVGTSLSALSLGIIVALFSAPHLHLHDLSLLIIPIMLVHPLAPALTSALLVSSYAFGWQHGVAYLLMIVFALLQLKSISQAISVRKQNDKATVSSDA